MTADSSTARTTPAATPAPVTWQPRGHRLVGWAAALLVAGVVVLATSVAFGLLTPRVSTDHSVTWGPESSADDIVFATFEVSNHAYATTRLQGAAASVPGMRVASVTLSPSDGGSALADGSVDLRHRQSAHVTIRWQVTDCELVPAGPEPIGLELRTPMRLTRTVDADAVSDLMATSTDARSTDEPGRGWARSVASSVCGPR